jgi:hypothetical protein
MAAFSAIIALVVLSIVATAWGVILILTGTTIVLNWVLILVTTALRLFGPAKTKFAVKLKAISLLLPLYL